MEMLVVHGVSGKRNHGIDDEWKVGVALCTQMDPELFFPERDTERKQIAQVKSVCSRCEVQKA